MKPIEAFKIACDALEQLDSKQRAQVSLAVAIIYAPRRFSAAYVLAPTKKRKARRGARQERGA